MGDRCQRIAKGNFFCSVLDEKYWEQDWRKVHSAEKTYPLIDKRLVTIFPKLIQRPSTILEICSGKGDTAEKLLENFSEMISSYLLVDRDAKSCSEAKKKLERFPQAKIHNQNLTLFNVDKIASSLDLVIGVGALTQRVVNEINEAKEILKKITPLIKSHGFLCLTGLTCQHLTVDAIASFMPLRVHNFLDPQLNLEFYVLEKDPTQTLRVKKGAADPFYYCKELNMSLKDALEELEIEVDQVREIDLSQLKSTGEDLVTLAKLPNLQKISLRNAILPAVDLFQLLTTWQNTLREVDLSYLDIDEEFLEHLHKEFPKLTSVGLANCEKIPLIRQAMWKILFALNNVKFLDLSFLEYSYFKPLHAELKNWIVSLLRGVPGKKVLLPKSLNLSSKDLPNFKVVQIERPEASFLFPPIKYLDTQPNLYADVFKIIFQNMKSRSQSYSRYFPRSKTGLPFSYELNKNGSNLIHLKGKQYPQAIDRERTLRKGLYYQSSQQEVRSLLTLSPQKHQHEISILNEIFSRSEGLFYPGLPKIYSAETFISKGKEKRHVVMEYYPYTLGSYPRLLSARQGFSCINDLLIGVHFLHKWGIIHGNIHLGSVMVKNLSEEKLSFALGNFEQSTLLGNVRNNSSAYFLLSPPEIIREIITYPEGHNTPTAAADIWMLGMLFASMYSYLPDWLVEAQENLTLGNYKRVGHEALLNFEKGYFLPKETPGFIRKMLSFEPAERPSAKEARRQFLLLKKRPAKKKASEKSDL